MTDMKKTIIKGFGVEWIYDPCSGYYTISSSDGKKYQTAEPEDALVRWTEWFEIAARRRIRKGRKKNVEESGAEA